MPPGRGWNEENLSELPAVEQLVALGYTLVSAATLDAERESPKQVILPTRLAAALARLNPGLSPQNIDKAIRDLASTPATSLIEASEKVYTKLAHGIALEDRDAGGRSRTVRFIDYDDPSKNEFLVTRQLTFQGARRNIRPDLMVFVNGIPIALIECKSPTLGEHWLEEAVDQVHRYQEIGDRYRDLGVPRLFHALQIIAVTCGQAAVYGTVTTPQRYYAEWKSAYPDAPDALAAKIGRAPTAQELLFHSLFAPANLLDVVRNFVAFERDERSGRIVRKLCRYQQFAAVNKALDRARRAKKSTERGGVVWHTQGSGKSLTMLWLALKLRRDPKHENPTLVIVTDRRDLDDQISKTFIACGFPNPTQAESVRDLRDLLSGPTGKTITTTVQKFQEIVGRGSGAKDKRTVRQEHPVLSEASNIFVLVDEAHRTQYGGLAGNLRLALPNACFFGFTGTPIDKNDRSTLQTFGSYIDTYTIDQAVTDGATVPIFYEGRLPELRILGNTLDAIFDRVFADRTDEERQAIKKKYANEQAIATAPKRIEAICLDLIDHYTSAIQPGKFKAQVVASTREAAALYKETFERLNAPQSAIVISVSNKEEANLQKWRLTDDQRKDTITRFCKEGDPLSILVVCDMLLTGFDAPIEQVMYLDSPLREHTLLQAIARVNRPCGDAKKYGLIVDYWGVSEALQEALAIFAPSDIVGAMTPKRDELPRLQTRHAAALRFFVRVRDRDDLNQCVDALAPEDVRAEFDTAFRRFSESLDMMLPDPLALPYAEDARWLGKIRAAAAARFRDAQLDISDCGAKVRKLIEDAVIADGIQILVKQVSLFTKDFDEKLKALKTDDARASEMEHAIRHEIHVKIDENPAFYASLRQRLEQIILDRKAKRIDAAKQLELLQAVTTQLGAAAQVAQKLGLTETGFAIYGLLRNDAVGSLAESPDGSYGNHDEAKRTLASLIEEAVKAQTEIVDWTLKHDVQREMRRRIKRHLTAAQHPADAIDALAEGVVDLLKRRGAR